MANSREVLWLGWAAKFAEIVEAMDLRFDSRDERPRYVNHYFHQTPDGELLQLITTGGRGDAMELNLYGSDGSSSPVASLALRQGGEIRIGSGTSEHRLEAGTALELVEFLKRITAKAVPQALPSPL